jgi:transcription initiation factor TFIIIB Brf1 subunit/transcription initiation factor TFIIB
VVENQNQNNQDTWSLYLYALKSPVTRQKYQKRLEKFFDFLGLEGSTVEDKSKSFIKRMYTEGENKNNNHWVYNRGY